MLKANIVSVSNISALEASRLDQSWGFTDTDIQMDDEDKLTAVLPAMLCNVPGSKTPKLISRLPQLLDFNARCILQTPNLKDEMACYNPTHRTMSGQNLSPFICASYGYSSDFSLNDSPPTGLSPFRKLDQWKRK